MGLHSARRVTWPSKRSRGLTGFDSCSSDSDADAGSLFAEKWNRAMIHYFSKSFYNSSLTLLGKWVALGVGWFVGTRPTRIYRCRGQSIEPKVWRFLLSETTNGCMASVLVNRPTKQQFHSLFFISARYSEESPEALSCEKTPKVWCGLPRLNLCSFGTTAVRPAKGIDHNEHLNI